MSEPEQLSAETKTELIPQEVPPETLEISGAQASGLMPPVAARPTPAVPPAPAAPAMPSPMPAPAMPAPLPSAEPPAPPAAAPPIPSAAAPPAASRPAYPEPAYPEPDAVSGPPTAAFVPPELLARRRAAAPPSTPYQPIAGWSTEPRAQASTGGPAGYPTAGYAPAPPTAPVAPGPPAAARVVADPAGPPPASPPVASPALATGPPKPPASRRNVLLATATAVVVIVALVAAAIVLNGGSGKTPAVAATPSASASAAPVAVKPDISSYDPLPNGSGFKLKNGAWATQRYTTVTFGNLKPGIGLVLDLGSAQELTSIAFDAGSGPLGVELRSADQKPSDLSDWKKVSGTASTSASGDTTLDASKAGKHQYWMIWVTRLGTDLKATISDVTVTAKP